MAASVLHGQFYYSPVFPDLQDGDLIRELRLDYRTTTVLDDSAVKDTLMAVIYYDADREEVTCVYTQHARPLSPDSNDPNQDVFDNGAASGLNVEHIYPRNKGARIGIAESDMHHLAPSKVNVNTDRGNLPFGENDDNQTDRWYWMSTERTSPPSTNIDAYSEWTNEAFEPREDFKGNVARAMMYFYTMYKGQADEADPVFFDAQIETLCDWHYSDPVDSAEWHRTWLIADFQEGIPNPFVLDCSVAARTYCPEVDQTCEMTVDTDELPQEDQLALFPNPASDYLIVEGLKPGTVFRLLSADGQVVDRRQRSTTRDRIDVSQLPNGIYFLQANDQVEKVIIQH